MRRYKNSKAKRDKDAARKRGQRAYKQALAEGKTEDEAQAAREQAKLRGHTVQIGGGAGGGRRQRDLPPVYPHTASDAPADTLTGVAAVRAKCYAMIDNAVTANELNAAVGALMKLEPEPELTEPPYVRHLREQAARCDDYIAIISAAQSIGVTEQELHAAEEGPLLIAARRLLETMPLAEGEDAAN